MKKCIVAPDSFKGSLSAAEICHIAEKSIHSFFPECDVISLPVADGGEGTIESMLMALSGEKITVKVHNPYMEEIESCYALFEDMAVIEMAKAAGLPLIEGRLQPNLTTTYGVGELILHAVKSGARDIVIGLGGSATNDGGCGCAAALGTKFTDINGKVFIPTGGTLNRVVDIDNSVLIKNLKGCKITAMCDIDNPMYGTNGAAYVFAPQKGADANLVKNLDDNLHALSDTFKKVLLKDVSNEPGSGAAGAMGAGIMAFMNGRLNSGIETILEMVKFDKKLAGCDAVITGEGKLDSQSLRGKAISGIAKHASMQNVPVYVFAGQIEDDVNEIYDLGVTAAFSINRRAETFEVCKYKGAENFKATFQDFLRMFKHMESL